MIVAIYRDPKGLPGETLARVIEALLDRGIHWTVCCGAVEGAGLPSALQEDGVAMGIDDFLRLVKLVKQFDWADFYLLSDEQVASGFTYSRRAYQDLIPQSEFLVRAVDDTYVYVFSTREVADSLEATGITWDSIEREDLGSFIFPD